MPGMIYSDWKMNVGLNVHEKEQMLSLSLRILDSTYWMWQYLGPYIFLDYTFSWIQCMSVCCAKLTNSDHHPFKTHGNQTITGVTRL